MRPSKQPNAKAPAAKTNGKPHTKPKTKPQTKTMIKPAAAPAAPDPEDDDPVPANIDDFRNELARRINRFIGNRAKYWRGCKEPACRRARACCAPQVRCSNMPPRTPTTPEQQARTRARVYRAVKDELARRAAAE